MKKMISTITGGYGPSARVVDGTLILSLPDAISPIVWRLDLTSVKSSALEVVEQNGQFVLVIRTAKGERTEIAPYDTKAKALAALMATSHALENSQGQMHSSAEVVAMPLPGRSPAAPAAQGSVLKTIGKIITAGLAIVLLVILIAMAMNISAPRVGLPTGTAPSGISAPAPGESRPGEPVSADSFLQGR